jgi:hypothetical protein
VSSDLAVSYEIVTHDRAGRERVHPYAGEDALAPGSVVPLGGRYWLVVRVEPKRVQAHLARYRLALHHPDGHRETGTFRRFRADAPSPGHQLITHQLITLEKGVPISWAIVDQRLACDDAGEPFLESIAERDYAEAESLADHELEHTLDQESDIAGVAASAWARAREAGFAIELVGLEAGQAPDWDEARRYLDSLILEEVEDDLLEQCGVDSRHDPQETWLDTVKQRLRDDLDSFRADIEDRHEEIEGRSRTTCSGVVQDVGIFWGRWRLLLSWATSSGVPPTATAAAAADGTGRRSTYPFCSRPVVELPGDAASAACAFNRGRACGALRGPASARSLGSRYSSVTSTIPEAASSAGRVPRAASST